MANIAIDDVTPRVSYISTAGQTVFNVPFPFSAKGDLRVYVNDVLKTLTTDYAVAGEGESEAGSRLVTFEDGLATNDAVVIVRDIPIARTTFLPTSGPLQIGALNTQLSKLFAIQQQLEDAITRTLRLAPSDPTENLDIPAVAERASKFLGFDAAGAPMVADAVTEVPVSSFMQTVLDDPNAPAARSTLGITDTTSYTGLSNWNLAGRIRGKVYGLIGKGPLDRFEALEQRGWLPGGWINGLVLSNDGTDATNDIGISAGSCRSTSNIGRDGQRTTLDSDQMDMLLPVSIIKQLDVVWAPDNYDPEGYSGGGRSGGRSSSSISNTTWHVFVIGVLGQQPDILLHDGVDPSAVLPMGYTAWRRIGSVLRSSGAILGFVQHGDRFLLKAAVENINNTADHTTAVLAALTVPTGVSVVALLSVRVNDNGTSGTGVYLNSPLQDDVEPGGSPPGLTIAGRNANAALWQGGLQIVTNTSAQIRYESSHADVDTTIVTSGWIDLRGREG